MGFSTSPKVSKTWGLCGSYKKDGKRENAWGRLKWVCKDARRVAGAVQETYFISILDHRTGRFTKMILHDRCSTSYDLASLFRGRRRALDRWARRITIRIGTTPSALHSLPELLRFWRCQCQKLSRRSSSFWSCQLQFCQEVLRDCFVLDVPNSTCKEVSHNCLLSDKDW